MMVFRLMLIGVAGLCWLAVIPLRATAAEEHGFVKRVHKDKDGKVEAEEYLAARRRNFDKLDLDHNGALSFQEYAAKGIEKFLVYGLSDQQFTDALQQLHTLVQPPAGLSRSKLEQRLAQAQHLVSTMIAQTIRRPATIRNVVRQPMAALAQASGAVTNSVPMVPIES